MVIIAILGIVVPLFWCWSHYKQREKRRTKERLVQLSIIGSALNLSFTACEVLKDCVMGVDGLKRQLLILETTKDATMWYTIHLRDIESCCVQKRIPAPARAFFHSRTAALYAHTIVVQFVLPHQQYREVVFFHSKKNRQWERQALEQKAAGWAAILRKMQVGKKEPFWNA